MFLEVPGGPWRSLEGSEPAQSPDCEDCLIKKDIAELTSSAIYKCLKVDAVVKNKKIVRIIKEIEVIK